MAKLKKMNTVSAINLETKGWIASNTKKMKESNPDDIINAWEMGVNRGLDLKEKIVKDYFEEKLNCALKNATDLFDILNKNVELNCTEAFFKINDITDFEVLYLVEMEKYLSKKLHYGYKEALKIKSECKKKDFSFSFSFKATTKHTQEELIFADGFTLKYDPKTRTA